MTTTDAKRPSQDVVKTEEAAVLPEQPYTTFGSWERRYILFLAAFSGMFSPMSSFVFYPAITAMSKSLGVSVGLINLAITTYMIVSGIVPSLIGNAADTLGRRPIYILALSIYFVANIGLAVQRSFPALLVLRMLQSAGSSGTISLGYGIISDITTPSERGFYVSLMLLGPNVAPPVGPVIGGALAAGLGWPWIFWFLCIAGGTCLLLVLLTLPETARVIVGNGSIAPPRVNRTPVSLLIRRRPGEPQSDPEPDSTTTTTTTTKAATIGRPNMRFPNPLTSLKLLLLRDVFIVLFCNGIYYMVYCCAQASLSSLFVEVYGYSELAAGLVYIPFGVGCLASLFVWGKLLDYDYARTAKAHGFSTDKKRNHGVKDFPIEKARLRSSLYLVFVATAATIGYGWAVQSRVHVSVPLILQALLGFSATGLFSALGTLLTDLNPTRSSTAAASANLVRCALAATFLAILEIMIDGMGVGWCFTLLGLLSGLCGPLLVLEMQKGQGWRKGRETDT